MKVNVYLDTGRCIDWDDVHDEIPAEVKSIGESFRTKISDGIAFIPTNGGWSIVPNSRIVSIDCEGK